MKMPALLMRVSMRPKRSSAFADDPVCGSGVGKVSADGEHGPVLGGLDRAGVGDDRPVPPPVGGDEAGADALGTSGDDGDPLAGSGHGVGQVLAVAGSLGCRVSGLVWTVIQASSGSDFRIACISAASWARQRPSERPSPGSVHSRSRCPCPASSYARSASRALVSSTVWAGVSSGMVTVKVVRNSVAPGLA